MNRRNVLLGLGTAAAGSGIVFGSGAFTQVQAERSVTIGIDQDSNALLALEASEDVASVYNSDETGELVIDTNELSDDNEGFNVGSTVQIGETDTDLPEVDEATVVDALEGSSSTGAAFKLTNNFDTVAGDDGDDANNLDIGINLEDVAEGSDSDPDSSLIFIGSEYDDQGGSVTNNETLTVEDGSQVIFNNVPPGNEIYFAIRIETTSTTDPEDFIGEVTFRAGPNLADEYPTDATVSDTGVVNVTQDTTHDSIQEAVSEANPGDLIQIGSGTYNSVDINTEGLTLEGPNAGIAGDSDQRGDEATITSGVFVDGNPSDVVIDGLAIERTIGEAEGVVQIGSTSNPGANNLTIRNNVITATSNGPRNLGTILIEQIDGEIQIEDNLLTQTGDGAGEGLVRGLVEAVQLENTAIVLDGNTIETDIGVGASGFDGPSPEYTITNNEFVENRVGVLVFESYDADELQAFEQNIFTGTADTTYVQDGGNQLNLTAVESDNQFNPNASEDTAEGVDILVPEE